MFPGLQSAVFHLTPPNPPSIHHHQGQPSPSPSDRPNYPFTTTRVKLSPSPSDRPQLSIHHHQGQAKPLPFRPNPPSIHHHQGQAKPLPFRPNPPSIHHHQSGAAVVFSTLLFEKSSRSLSGNDMLKLSGEFKDIEMLMVIEDHPEL
ncbi:hypothetical protein F7725_017712 [Dissostichus mawsoni]|uniref:Uncharacterized protein n=1 Tax=Dissostichus mawsoni TaxID=36200 RepID=A0A7J5XPE0_DISMA|nr:hypothetical protein F7725_017712 [Dissostichus mawsoni]